MKLLHGLEGKIGQVAQLTGMTVEAIRYYEKEKILNPERSQGSTYRTYVDIPEKQHNRPEGTACCSASNGMPPDD